MAEASGFMQDIGGDRRYSAEEFAKYLRKVLTNGVFNGGTELQVLANDTDMNSRVQIGTAWIRGYYYENHTEEKRLTHEAADLVNDRIDRIVLRLDLRTEARSIKTFIKKGTPALEPVAPELVRDMTAGVLQWELSLAQVLIPVGSTQVLNANITDERLDQELCGIVNSLITLDTASLAQEWNEWFDSKTNEVDGEYHLEWKTWFESVKDESYLTKENADTYYAEKSSLKKSFLL